MKLILQKAHRKSHSSARGLMERSVLWALLHLAKCHSLQLDFGASHSWDLFDDQKSNIWSWTFRAWHFKSGKSSSRRKRKHASLRLHSLLVTPSSARSSLYRKNKHKMPFPILSSPDTNNTADKEHGKERVNEENIRKTLKIKCDFYFKPSIRRCQVWSNCIRDDRTSSEDKKILYSDVK